MIDLSLRIHGILFVAGEDGVTLEQLQETLKADPAIIVDMLQKLQNKLQLDQASPYQLTVFDGNYQLMTKNFLNDDVKMYARSPLTQKLSRSALEALAIVAYQQPVTRAEIDEIRGVNSANMMTNLAKRGLLEEVGREEGPGRPFLYGTSVYFLEYFGLETLAELPALNPIELEDEIVNEHLFSFNSGEVINKNEGD